MKQPPAGMVGLQWLLVALRWGGVMSSRNTEGQLSFSTAQHSEHLYEVDRKWGPKTDRSHDPSTIPAGQPVTFLY